MLKRFGADQRGLAAIEFALLAPVMIALYCGVAELTMAMMAERRAAHAASVVADLVAQTNQIKGSEVRDIFTVGNQILAPFSTTGLKMRITSVVADSKGVAKVDWSVTGGLAAMQTGTAVSGFPPNLLTAGDSVIMADVQYAYTSPLMLTLPKPITFNDTFYLRPRSSSSVILLAGA
jgi:Flp pilus assembly protein TadG